MKIIIKTRKDNREPAAYDMDILLPHTVPIPNIGERFFFYHRTIPMFLVVNERTFELLNYKEESEYQITLWGSYHLNIEGQRGEKV